MSPYAELMGRGIGLRSAGAWRDSGWPALALVLLIAAGVEAAQGSWDVLPPMVRVALIAFGIGPLAVLNRKPVVAIVVTVAASELVMAVWGSPKSLVMFFVMWVAAYGTAVHAPLRRSVLWPLVAFQFSLVFVAEFTGDSGWAWSDLLFSIVLFSFAFGLGLIVRRRSHQLQSARAETRQTQLAAARVVAAERARIARDLHDVVAHSVSLMVVQAAAARSVIDRRPEVAVTAIDAIESAGQQALGELRRMLEVMRDGTPSASTPQPGLASIAELVESARRSGTSVELRAEGLTDLPSGPQVAAYRIVQESLTNAVRYAAGAPVSVTLSCESDVLHLSVVNGPSAAPRLPVPESGYGLVGMRERAALYGGTLRAGPEPGGGWRVTASLRTDVHPSVLVSPHDGPLVVT